MFKTQKKINLQTLPEWLLYLFVFLLPWQTRWIIKGAQVDFQQISVYSFDIILALLLGLFIILNFKFQISNIISSNKTHQFDKLRVTMNQPKGQITNQIPNPKSKLQNKLLVTLAFLGIVWSTLSLIWADNFQLASYWVLRLLLVLGLVWILGKIKFNLKMLAWILLVAILLQALLGIGQFIYQDDLITSKWLGMSSQVAAEPGTSVIETGNARWLRAHGSQPHPNILGGLLVLGILLSFNLLSNFKSETLNPKAYSAEAAAKAGYISNFKFQISKLQITGYGLQVINLFLVTALFFTFSRSAWLALGIVFIFWLLKNIKNYELQVTRPHRLPGLIGMTGAASYKLLIPAILLTLILVLIYQPLFQTRLSATSRLEQQSIKQRTDQLEQAYTLFKSNPILGVGTGNYTIALQKNFPELKSYEAQPVHSIYLLILVELGIIGLTFFVFVLIVVIKNIRNWEFRNYLEIKNLKLKIPENPMIAILGSLLIIGFLDHYFWTLPSMVFIFWLILGLIFSKKHQID